MTHLPTEEATRRLNNWRTRQDSLICLTSLAIGTMFGEGWESAPRWLLIWVIVLVFAWLVSVGNTVRAERRLELSVEERDAYREQRWQELHQEELLELHDTISQLRRELADTTPHVH